MIRLRFLLLASSGALASCGIPDDVPPVDEQVGSDSEALAVEQTLTSPDGYRVIVEAAGTAPVGTERIAACDPWIVYAVTGDKKLFVSEDSGGTFAPVGVDAPSTIIACDTQRLLALTPRAGLTPPKLSIAGTQADGSVSAYRRADGKFTTWFSSHAARPIS